MKLQLFKHTAAFHFKAANIAFSNGDALKALSHVRAAFHAAANKNRSRYRNAVSKWLIKPNDNIWDKQTGPTQSKVLAIVLTLAGKWILVFLLVIY